MRLYRCSPWRVEADPLEPDGAIWFPRAFQGSGRHDNPDSYGCLYLAEAPISCVVEQLARFRGTSFAPSMLRRRRLPLALLELDLDDGAAATRIDLDDPVVLLREGLRPSRIATRDRRVTQATALALFGGHPGAAGLRWWSTFEASWANATIFDRSAASLRVVAARELTAADPVVAEARDVLGI